MQNPQPQTSPEQFIGNLDWQLRAKEQGFVYKGGFLPYHPSLVEKARELRKSMTAAEKRLWFGFLRSFHHRVLRQRPIDHYIVDFYCAALKLVIEIDGDIHDPLDAQEYDARRTEILEWYGLHVLRFSNRVVQYNFDEVCRAIEAAANPPIIPMWKTATERNR
jgi:very-short-patch-repair endonuclease